LEREEIRIKVIKLLFISPFSITIQETKPRHRIRKVDVANESKQITTKHLTSANLQSSMKGKKRFSPHSQFEMRKDGLSRTIPVQ
jgi:hypothetical protein